MDVVITPRGIPTYIFNNYFPTSDGTFICDYIHVSDDVIAIPEWAFRLRTYTMGKCKILNLGTKMGSSVLDVIKTINRVRGKRVDIKVASRREGDLARSIANTELASVAKNIEAEYILFKIVNDHYIKWKAN